MSKPKSAFLVIVQANINGGIAQTEIPTTKDPFQSRQVRRDCEVAARAAFVELAKSVGFEFDGRLKCVECLEVKDDGDDAQGH